MEHLKKAVKSFGLPRIIILSFFFLLLITARIYNMNMGFLFSDIIRRWGMFGILVLAMVPGIQSGIGPNFGVSIGIIGGLLGGLVSMELRFRGFLDFIPHDSTGFGLMSIFLAILFAIFFSSIFGILYGLLLNRVKGNEMIVSTYIGFSFVALFNILWLILPFRNTAAIWPIAGQGLRNTVNLVDDFGMVFNRFLMFERGSLRIPTGLILVFLLTCFFAWLFTKSRLGMLMSAAGANPSFAKSSGINVNQMRVLGTAVSTALGGVGIVVYAQSFGFLQLYNAPQMMGFLSVAAVLIGGGTIGRAGVANVLIGTFLFHGVLTVAAPVANHMFPDGTLAEIVRPIISNGIILYALSKAKGGARS